MRGLRETISPIDEYCDLLLRVYNNKLCPPITTPLNIKISDDIKNYARHYIDDVETVLREFGIELKGK